MFKINIKIYIVIVTEKPDHAWWANIICIYISIQLAGVYGLRIISEKLVSYKSSRPNHFLGNLFWRLYIQFAHVVFNGCKVYKSAARERR